MPKGKVKWFSALKGYGIIEDETGKEIYVDQRDIIPVKGIKALQVGQEVTFELAKDLKGDKAVNVKPVE